MTAAAFIDARINRAYSLTRFNCWTLVLECQRKLYGRSLPAFRGRDAKTRSARLLASSDASLWQGWALSPSPEDGAVVFLSREGAMPDIHAGVWINRDGVRGLLHCDSPHGVVLDDMSRLAVRGWTALKFYIPD